MMIQHQQMHQMVMQQIMLQQLPGGGGSRGYPAAVMAAPAEPVMVKFNEYCLYLHHGDGLYSNKSKNTLKLSSRVIDVRYSKLRGGF